LVIRCNNCGYYNRNTNIRCDNCGIIINDTNNYNNTVNTQQNTTKESKSKFISAILSLLLVGLGYIYLDLYERFFVSVVVAIAITTISSYFEGELAGIIFSLMSLIWMIIVIIDGAYCCDAINNKEEKPKYMGLIQLN